MEHGSMAPLCVLTPYCSQNVTDKAGACVCMHTLKRVQMHFCIWVYVYTCVEARRTLWDVGLQKLFILYFESGFLTGGEFTKQGLASQ